MAATLPVARRGRRGRDRVREGERLRGPDPDDGGVRRGLRPGGWRVPPAHAGPRPDAGRGPDHGNRAGRGGARGGRRHQCRGAVGEAPRGERRARPAPPGGSRAGRGVGGAREPAASGDPGRERGRRGLHAPDGRPSVAARERISKALPRCRSVQLQGDVRQRIRHGRLRALVPAAARPPGLDPPPRIRRALRREPRLDPVHGSAFRRRGLLRRLGGKRPRLQDWARLRPRVGRLDRGRHGAGRLSAVQPRPHRGCALFNQSFGGNRV